MKSYGEVVLSRRKALGLSLRVLARRSGLHAGNLSYQERGRWKPPVGLKVLRKVLRGLDWSAGSDEGQLVVLLAAVENGRLPRWVKEDAKLTREVAVFLWRKRRRVCT